VTTRATAALSQALRGRLVIVCGPGGVGKTTLSASLALASAGRGRRTLVCTIDPSKRLRTSLGLAKLTGRPEKVTPRLYAMRLDPKQTFDDLVRRHAASPEARERILSNRFYQQISRHLAGTHEVMAMEALMAVIADYDLVVLDTPPASSALAFLDAPKRVLEFVDGRILRYFLKPYFMAGRLAIEPRTMVGRSLLRILDGAVGLQFLRELSEFFLAFEGLFDSFRQTATEMGTLLKADGTAFVLAMTPTSGSIGEAASFAQALKVRSLKAAAVVVNRVHPWALPGARGWPSDADEIPTRLPGAIRSELEALALRENARARGHARQLRRISAKGGIPVLAIPEFDSDVHDLESLSGVAACLDSGGERP